MVKRLSIALAGLCAASLLAPATAQVAPRQIVTSIGVRYGDLDLESGSDARAMLARLDLAATKACGGKPAPVMPGDQVGLAKRREYRACKAAAMESSTRQLGSPLVRTAWLEKRAPSAILPHKTLRAARSDIQSLTP